MAVAKKTAPTIREPDSLYERENTRLVGQVAASPLVTGKAVNNVVVSVGSVRVNHRLGRPAVGFFVTDSTEPVTVYRDSDGVSAADYFYLLADMSATVNLWVF